jgi:glutamine synthetase
MAETLPALDIERLPEQGIDVVQLEIPDLDGVLRGKMVPASKVKPDGRGGFCTILYQLTPMDDIWSSPHSSFDNGYPDMLTVLDPSTLIRMPARSDMAAIMLDMRTVDNQPYLLAPRNVLKRVTERFEETGFEPLFGVEYEAFVLQADDALIAAGRHHELPALDPSRNAYRLNGIERVRSLGVEFINRMKSSGIEVEAFHTELGPGAVEFALSPRDPVAAADNAVRAKTYFRQLCAEQGLAVTFMAKWKIDESGCGGHVHQSLSKNGVNVFCEPGSAEFSQTALRYLSGLLATMQDFAVLFRPNVNSYRRMDARSWSPETASWGYDTRTAAIRAIRLPNAQGFRFEHRAPGADANIYLVLAAMLAGGHYGLSRDLPTPAATGGKTDVGDKPARLPDTIPSAVEAFRTSPITRDYLGAAFVDHYSDSRTFEWELWMNWLSTQVTSFELRRYFGTI